MDHSRDLDLLLLGKTGNGKSKTGNTILGWKAFKFSASANSVTKIIVGEAAEFNGRRIRVVDGPGVGDTIGTEQEANRLVMEQLNKAIVINARGYHAFLLVVRFGGRFERNDKNAVDFLKDIFGHDFIRNHGILLFTCGDSFKHEFEGQGKTIQLWCQEQSGPLRELYEECGGRVVLFNNMTKKAEKIKAQRNELFTMVDNLTFQGERYTNKHFAKAQSARERRMIQDKTALIDQETMTETRLILQQLKETHQLENLGERQGQLQELRTRCDTLYKKLKTEDKGTGLLNKLFHTVKDISQTVNSEIDECGRIIAERENLRRRQEEIEKQRKNMEEQEKREREQKFKMEQEMQKREVSIREKEEKLLLEQQEMQKKEQELKEEQEALSKQETKWRQEKEEEEEILETEYTEVRDSNDDSLLETVALAAGGALLAVGTVVAGVAAAITCIIS